MGFVFGLLILSIAINGTVSAFSVHTGTAIQKVNFENKSPYITLSEAQITEPKIIPTASSVYGTNNVIVPKGYAPSFPTTPVILDPNPTLIDSNGTLKNDSYLATKINTTRIGTIADGTSKLVILSNYSKPVSFKIKGVAPDNITEGTLSPLGQTNTNASSVTVAPQNAGQQNPYAVIAVYTPPDHLALSKKESNSHRTIDIVVQDKENSSKSTSTKIDIYRVPVVLVHGIWSNPQESWNNTKFISKLEKNGYNVSLADYGAHNATTFDPYAILGIGNYGINATKNATKIAIQNYHNKSIAASQVDVVSHSMGGLIARGFVQQPDYKSVDNYMNGSIHRLVTIGTPHYGGQLAGPLYSHRDDWYCYSPSTNAIIFPNGCQFDLQDFEFMQLKTIYASKLHTPIDDGGVQALIPDSKAYSHLCPTNVTSYAIAGSWAPLGITSHLFMESFFKNILGYPFTYDLDRDGFHGNFQGNNDLQVNLTSQLGGLYGQFRQIGNSAIPNEGEISPNTIHSSHLLIPFDINATSELYSLKIQQDVVSLLNSSDTKFSPAIGFGSPCKVPR